MKKGYTLRETVPGKEAWSGQGCLLGDQRRGERTAACLCLCGVRRQGGGQETTNLQQRKQEQAHVQVASCDIQCI